MKILHIAYFGQNRQMNGVAEAVLNLARAQIKLGENVKLAMINDHDLVDGKFIYYIKKTNEFKNLLENFKPDIVSFHSIYYLQQITFSKILRKKSIPYVYVFHGGASSDNAKKHALKKQIGNFIFFNRIIRHAKKVVYLNENEKNKSVFIDINNNGIVIPNGVELHNNPFLDNKSGIINISFISRMDYWGKGLDILFEVICKIKNTSLENKVRFSFFGYDINNTGEKFDKVGDLSHYYGYVSGDKKEKAFLDSDIMILPSRSEGMPMTVLESLSYGVPCIVTPETNMADLIEAENCGWVTTLSVDDMLNTIEKSVFELPSKKKEYFENCKRAVQSYSWNNIASLTINMYKKIKSNG